MGLDIWFQEDIRNALLAANEGGAPPIEVIRYAVASLGGYETGHVAVLVQVYRLGYLAALTTVALAFGLSPKMLRTQHGQDAEGEREPLAESDQRLLPG